MFKTILTGVREGSFFCTREAAVKLVINQYLQTKKNASGLAFLLNTWHLRLTPHLSLQISMGQNQDKLDGGEQALTEGPEEMGPNSDSGGVGSHTGDVMEGGIFCEEEAGNTGENSREPDTLDGRPSQEPTTPFSEQNINFAVREVRLGGATGKEGGGGGGRVAVLAPQETEEENQQCSARVEERARSYKLYSQIKREEKRTEEGPNTSSKIKMEDTVPDEEIQDEDSSASLIWKVRSSFYLRGCKLTGKH